MNPKSGFHFWVRWSKTRIPEGTDQKQTMRAEIEHLVEETKQSVGLLRRHL